MITRRLCLSLLLMLAISHVTLLVHASGHTGPEQITCQLCVCQSQLGHAISPSIQLAPVVNNVAPRTWQWAIADTLPVLQLAYYQRGPPAIA